MAMRFIAFKKAILYLSYFLGSKRINVMSVEETLKYLNKREISICRYGDGEMDIINGKSIGFQKFDKELADRLDEILCSKPEKCAIAIPESVAMKFQNLTDDSYKFWISNQFWNRKRWVQKLSNDYIYCNAHISRMYIRYADKTNCSKNFNLLKKLWEKEDVLVVEGAETRLGVGNDLLSGSSSIQRLLAPTTDSYQCYHTILEKVKIYGKGKTIILALGPTATVLAWDLAQQGYRALDLGHCDVEYEWFLRNSQSKAPLDYKYVNETNEKITRQTDMPKKIYETYISQIVGKIKVE